MPITCGLLLFLVGRLWVQNDPKLQQIAAFPDQDHQVTGITVANDSRVFLCFPYWSDPHPTSVARLESRNSNTLVPYPDENWNREEGAPADHFICVQSVIDSISGVGFCRRGPNGRLRILKIGRSDNRDVSAGNLVLLVKMNPNRGRIRSFIGTGISNQSESL